MTRRLLPKRPILAALALSTAVLAPAESFANPHAPNIWYDGQESQGVRCVQEILAFCAGHTHLTMDGKYGPQTRQAVLALQQFFRLRMDGVVGPLTGDALKVVGQRCNAVYVGRYDMWAHGQCEHHVPTTH